MTRTLLAGMFLFATAAEAEQIVPVTPSTDIAATHDIRLRNTSATDALAVTLQYETDGHSAAIAAPIRIEPGEQIILSDIVRVLFGMTTDTIGEIRAHAPEQIEVHWRRNDAGPAQSRWLPSVSSASAGVAPAAVRRRRPLCFSCNLDPPTLVKVGDVATFAGSHRVSGTATIVDRRTIRVSGLVHDGTAPGLDIRVGLSTMSRRDFAIVRVTGREAFQNATLDLVLPDRIDLNSFDTFTVWCYEFATIIAEGKFRRP